MEEEEDEKALEENVAKLQKDLEQIRAITKGKSDSHETGAVQQPSSPAPKTSAPSPSQSQPPSQPQPSAAPKEKLLQPEPKKAVPELENSVNDLTNAIRNLTKLVDKAASDEYANEEKDANKRLLSKIDKLIKQNEEIAKGILLILEIEQKHLPNISRSVKRAADASTHGFNFSAPPKPPEQPRYVAPAPQPPPMQQSHTPAPPPASQQPVRFTQSGGATPYDQEVPIPPLEDFYPNVEDQVSSPQPPPHEQLPQQPQSPPHEQLPQQPQSPPHEQLPQQPQPPPAESPFPPHGAEPQQPPKSPGLAAPFPEEQPKNEGLPSLEMEMPSLDMGENKEDKKSLFDRFKRI